ncbi:MAG: TIGR03790 family protein [Puniceicoccaceae bacterium]
MRAIGQAVLWAVVALWSVAPVSGALDPAGVVVVANASDPESVELAEHYARARDIPAGNILSLPMPGKETVSGMDFVKTIWDPLLEALIDAEWIRGSFGSGRDDHTRRRVSVYGHRIEALVLCKGVPLRIAHEDLFFSEADAKRLPQQFQTTRASVDSELALLPMGGYPMAGPIRNPVYERRDPPGFAAERIVRVSRLDGPTYASARRLVDSALEAEAVGLRGRAYVDTGGPHESGDAWLGEVAEILEGVDYPLEVDRGKPVVAASARFDAPALYFGWYTRSIAGVWKDLDLSVPPGAIALHIHSFSATTLRNRDEGWAGPLVARGVAATVGNVYEPYLEGTHNPVLFLDSLLAGKTLVEAATRSNRFLSWQTILIGDPLYRPFALDLEQQLEKLAPTDPFAQYAMIRELNRLRREEGIGAAADYGKRSFGRTPGFALGLEAARLLREDGRADEALDLLGPFRHATTAAPDEIAVVVEIALLFDRLGDTASALRLLSGLADSPGAPLVLQLSILKKAREVSQRAGSFVKAEQFRQEIERRKPAGKPTG